MSDISYNELMSRKNLNLLVGLITLLIVLWAIMFAIPGLFIIIFDTFLGNLILIGFILLAGFYNIILAVGLAAVFLILYRFSHFRIEQFFI
jgi:hypothetical protein